MIGNEFNKKKWKNRWENTTWNYYSVCGVISWVQALETRSGILPFLLHYLTISKKSDAWCNSLMSHYVEISLPREATAKRGICYNTFSVRLHARLFFCLYVETANKSWNSFCLQFHHFPFSYIEYRGKITTGTAKCTRGINNSWFSPTYQSYRLYRQEI